MIQMGTQLVVVDNSGAGVVNCIKALGGYKRTFSYSGDFIVISIRKLRLIRKVKTGEIYFALVVRTSKATHFKDGSYSSFQTNAAILLGQNKKFLGTRVFGPVSRQLRKKKFLKVLIMSGQQIF